MRARTVRRAVPKTVTYIVLAALSFLILLPFAWMLISSLKTNQQLFTIPIKWWVWPLHFDNYTHALSLIPFWSQLGNTVFLSISTVVGTVLSCSFVAYGLARVDWPGRRPLFGLLLVTMLLPGIVTLVPTYVIFRELGWVNTYLPLIVPTFLGTPFYIFLFRQFFLRIPESISEAARVDGAVRAPDLRHHHLPGQPPCYCRRGGPGLRPGLDRLPRASHLPEQALAVDALAGFDRVLEQVLLTMELHDGRLRRVHLATYHRVFRVQ